MRMRSTDYILLAFRNIMHQRSRSLLAILAIVIGTTSVTIMLALVIGAKNFYYDQFKATGQLEQVIVNPQTGLDFQQSQQAANCESCVKLTGGLADKIKSYDHVTGLSRTADVNVFESATLGGKKQVVNGAQGYEPNGIIKHVFLAGGDFNGGSGTGKVIIGQNYADQWGYKDSYQAIIGKRINLTTSSSFTGDGATLPNPLVQFKQCQNGCQADQITAQQPTTLKATVVGVESDNSSGLFLPLKWAKGLLTNHRYEITKQDQTAYTTAYTTWHARGQLGPEPMPKFTLVANSQIDKNGYSTFVVKADNTSNTDAVAKQISKLGVGVATAKSYIKDQLQVFNIVSFILAGIGSIALVVAAVGIINTMVTAVLERTREIGVMRAVGAKRSTVRRLFTLEASLLGFLGGTFGIAFGYGLILLANFFINAQLADNAVLSRNIISLPGWLIFAVIITTTVIGMMAGLYPAHRAAKLDPVEALRHE
jgi:ABC-type antimicrobial peptide transport system permease subunit